MSHREVELLAIGAGPSNLALAVAIEELAPDDMAHRTLVIEREDSVAWQRGMLLPDALSQVSFLKDLVTLRNPCSEFSFVNFLHEAGRLNEFANMGSFLPFRAEFSRYLQWVADRLERVQVAYGQTCTAIDPAFDPDGTLVGWRVELADGSTIACRYLCIGAGRDAYVPEEMHDLPEERLIHSTEYVPRIAALDKNHPYRVVVVGAAQSAAEMFAAVQDDLPHSQATMVMRSIGLNTYETSKFTNELFYPSFVEEFYEAVPEARAQILAQMHQTNYGGIAPGMHDSLYRKLYLDRLHGRGRIHMRTLVDVIAARMDDDDVVLTLRDRRNRTTSELRADLVLLGTGFVREMPRLVRSLAGKLGIDTVEVTRNYRMRIPHAASAACYLQGVNEATHGIADSLLSVLASRADDIAHDIFVDRDADALIADREAASVPTA